MIALSLALTNQKATLFTKNPAVPETRSTLSTGHINTFPWLKGHVEYLGSELLELCFAEYHDN